MDFFLSKVFKIGVFYLWFWAPMGNPLSLHLTHLHAYGFGLKVKEVCYFLPKLFLGSFLKL